MISETNHTDVEKLHNFRVEIDALIKKAKASQDSRFEREMTLAQTKLEEAKMWVGKCLGKAGSKLPEEFRDEAPTGGVTG